VRRRRGRYLQEPAGSFPVIPMIDVMLNLLIFFMLISRYLPPSLDITLPEASSSAVEDQPGVMILMDMEGRLAVNGNEIDWEELASTLSTFEKDRQVRIAADRNTDYDYIVKAMDACAQAGLSRIALETSRPQ
jgi:biopolymer transport protein ExbD